MKSIIVNNVTHTDEYENCQQFNDYFFTIGKKVHETIPDNSMNNVFFNYLNESQSTRSFEFSRVSVQEIKNEFMSLKYKRYHISIFYDKILKYISNLVSPLITYIMNRSITFGSYPQFPKFDRAIPIVEGGDPTQLGYYRPISILPIFSKVFEKIVYKQKYIVLNKFDLLHSDQFEFRKKLVHLMCNIQYFTVRLRQIDHGSVVV